MDLEAVKVLLDSQERAFRSAMDLVVEQLNKRTELVEGTVTDLIKSLEFSQAEIVDLKNNIKVLQKTLNEKQVIIEGLESKVSETVQRLNYNEDYSRRNNLRITGLQEQAGETWENTSTKVSKMINDNLELPPVSLERAHRVGPVNPSRPRPVVVRFEKYSDRETVIRNAKKLKGTGIYISEDLCPASQEIKMKQLPLLKKARDEGKIAYFRHTRLIIKEKTGQQSSFSTIAADPTHRGAGPTPCSSGGGGAAHSAGTGTTGGVSSAATGDSQTSASKTATSLTGALPKVPSGGAGGASSLLPHAGADGMSTETGVQMGGGMDIMGGRTQKNLRERRKK